MQNEVLAQEVDKQKMKEVAKKRLQQESENISNNLRKTFGYNPQLNGKTVNYKSTKMQIAPISYDLEEHVLKKDNQYLPLQKLIQEERERVMVVEKGIDTAETTRFFIEKIKEYNSIIDLEHIKKNKKLHKISSASSIDQEPSTQDLQNSAVKNDQMKRYTGDQGQITNFHFVINWQNLVPVFRELSGDTDQHHKVIRHRNALSNLKSKLYDKKRSKPIKERQPKMKNRMEKLFDIIEQKHEIEFKKLQEQKDLEKAKEVKDQEEIDEEEKDKIEIEPNQKEIKQPTLKEDSIQSKTQKKIEISFSPSPSPNNKLKTESTNKDSTTPRFSLLGRPRSNKNKVVSLKNPIPEKRNIKYQLKLKKKTLPNISINEFKSLSETFQKIQSNDVTQRVNQSEEIERNDIVQDMIKNNFDEFQMVKYLTNQETLFQQKIKSRILKSIVNNSEKGVLDEKGKKKLEGEVSLYLQEIGTDLNRALTHRKIYRSGATSERNSMIGQLTIPQQQIQSQHETSQEDWSPVTLDYIRQCGVKLNEKQLTSTENQFNSLKDNNSVDSEKLLLIGGKSNYTKQMIKIKSLSSHEEKTLEKIPAQQELPFVTSTIQRKNAVILMSQGNSFEIHKSELEGTKRRQKVISELIARKQPKFIHPGGTKFAVLNTTENINMYNVRKPTKEVNETSIKPFNVQENMLTNLFVLQGPPKKLDYGASDLKHDYNDLKVSKMMKNIDR